MRCMLLAAAGLPGRVVPVSAPVNALHGRPGAIAPIRTGDDCSYDDDNDDDTGIVCLGLEEGDARSGLGSTTTSARTLAQMVVTARRARAGGHRKRQKANTDTGVGWRAQSLCQYDPGMRRRQICDQSTPCLPVSLERQRLNLQKYACDLFELEVEL